MKACTKCKKFKTSNCFYSEKRNLNGLMANCKTCINERNKIYFLNKRKDIEWVLKERDRKRTYQTNYYSKLSKNRKLEIFRNNRSVKYWREKYPERYRAHNVISHQIVSGKLIKPEACFNCLSEISKLEAHHKNYNKPLDVIWLCKKCHSMQHRKYSLK